MKWIEVAPGNNGFVYRGSLDRFVPWGFNYDRDDKMRQIEDYWEQEWNTVKEDFQEMKALGANIVRVHLQLGKIMMDEHTADKRALKRVRRLTKLAQRLGLYLDVTGLACYDKQRVPAWYNALGESERWEVQARFWEAIAATCADSPAIFCYDLMNEPVAPGTPANDKDWLPGEGFAGKHYVQLITLDPPRTFGSYCGAAMDPPAARSDTKPRPAPLDHRGTSSLEPKPTGTTIGFHS